MSHEDVTRRRQVHHVPNLEENGTKENIQDKNPGKLTDENQVYITSFNLISLNKIFN